MRNVTIFALLSTLSAAQAVILIDDFSSGLSNLVDTTPTMQVVSFQAGLPVYGGTRAHSLFQISSGLNGTSTSDVNGGLFGSNTLQSRSQTDMYWGAVGANSNQQIELSNTRNYDFSANRIFRVSLSAASVNTRISLLLGDLVPGIPQKLATDRITLGSEITTPTVLTFDFTDTPTQLSAGFNFGAVDFIRLTVESPTSGGNAINRVDAVPEPATMSALLLGAGMLVRRRRAGK